MKGALSEFLKMPCGNCPFRREGAIPLQEGRLQQIASDLLDDDHRTFWCHKSVHTDSGGDWDDDGDYRASGQEKMCAGAAAFLMKQGRPTISMRLALITRAIPRDYWAAAEDITIDTIVEGEHYVE